MRSKKVKKWTRHEDRILESAVSKGGTSLCRTFMAVADKTGRTPKAVSQHYYLMKSSHNENPDEVEDRRGMKWEAWEDAKILEYVRASPHNLARCFVSVAEVIGRSAPSCANRWYQTLSRRPDVNEIFTLTSSSCSRNRKNGIGTPISLSLWKRFLRLLGITDWH